MFDCQCGVLPNLPIDSDYIGHLTPTCVHDVFCVAKSGGDGYRAIIDCSKPPGRSVNNYVDKVCTKFFYKGLDHLISSMKRFDFIATIDI